jgi:hypothetical protein
MPVPKMMFSGVSEIMAKYQSLAENGVADYRCQ